ncbi:hypothetical protein E2C01_100673 [Portunus trituberculatus]|uniref:Uncharacterized protein n=1 Tax=Portunus trituberculatus TaxID=210409 RepID=A0A5B7KI64_PORTR|nr:hypothetical protein [Portunus trituberculatus]
MNDTNAKKNTKPQTINTAGIHTKPALNLTTPHIPKSCHDSAWKANHAQLLERFPKSAKGR